MHSWPCLVPCSHTAEDGFPTEQHPPDKSGLGSALLVFLWMKGAPGHLPLREASLRDEQAKGDTSHSSQDPEVACLFCTPIPPGIASQGPARPRASQVLGPLHRSSGPQDPVGHNRQADCTHTCTTPVLEPCSLWR